MTLSSDVTINRNLGIGASDAKRIVDGDWLKLWEEKTGRRQPDDLSDVFPVQLGSYTESFHAQWFGKRTGFDVEPPHPFYVHPGHEFMFCHLDAWLPWQQTFVELKHSNGNATLDDKARYYMPQLQHEMAVVGVDECWFSVIPGNGEPLFGTVARDQSYIDELILLERSFWWHVEKDDAPADLPENELMQVKELTKKVLVAGLREYDMAGSNAWCDHALTIRETESYAKRFETAKKSIKELVPPDASKCSGHGVTFKRAKNGNLLMSTD